MFQNRTGRLDEVDEVDEGPQVILLPLTVTDLELHRTDEAPVT